MTAVSTHPGINGSGRPSVEPRPWVEDPSEQRELWHRLVSHTVHPTKVVILEAFLWIGVPLSKTELTHLFRDGGEKEEHYVSLVTYHVETLVGFGLLEEIDSRAVRGATETYYFLCRT